jgi:hypothetical protein
MTLLQKKIFQLGMNGLQQKDLTNLIEMIEKELARRKEEENTCQANAKKDVENTNQNMTTSEVESGN